METGQRAWKDRESGQTGLFGMASEEPEHVEHPLPALPDWTTEQKLAERERSAGHLTSPAIRWMQYSDKVAELATHDTETLEGLERGAEVAHLRHPHRHPARATRRQAVGRDAPGRSQGRRGSDGLHHAVRSAAHQPGGGSGGAGARLGAARRERAAQDLHSGHRAARGGARESADADFHPRVAWAPTATRGQGRSAQPVVHAQARRDRGPAAAGETARFFRYPGCGAQGPPGQRVLGGSGTNLRAGVLWRSWPT